MSKVDHMTQQLSCLTDREKPWFESRSGHDFSSIDPLVAQCGSTARAASIEGACFAGSSVVPSGFGENLHKQGVNIKDRPNIFRGEI